MCKDQVSVCLASLVWNKFILEDAMPLCFGFRDNHEEWAGNRTYGFCFLALVIVVNILYI